MSEADKEKWRATMVRIHGSEEAVRLVMQERQKKSRKNYSGDGGLRALSPERRKEISEQGVKASIEARKKHAKS